jgi:2,4-dienoyl-CoA reductase-like NADH-dependent reductase (Old Yellow Enzyme family)
MERNNYRLFSAGKIGTLTLKNRIVRSATYEPGLQATRTMSEEVLGRYRALAEGGAGLLIGTEFHSSYRDSRPLEGLERIPQVVHAIDQRCKVATQVAVRLDDVNAYSTAEIEKITRCVAQDIIISKQLGFDAAQIHAAHSFTVNQMLTPITNHRSDKYGGSMENRCRFIREIVKHARAEVGDYPIFIKIPAKDVEEGGITFETFPPFAREICSCGVDAIEISIGYTRNKQAYRNSVRNINVPEKESYFFPYAQAIDLNIPVMVVGGSRHAERCEELLKTGKVDFISVCRPLICEPDLPNRWLEGRGKETAECVFCNSCYESYSEIGLPNQCLYKTDKELYRKVQEKSDPRRIAFLLPGMPVYLDKV